MPTPKKYTDNAARQKAYRERKKLKNGYEARIRKLEEQIEDLIIKVADLSTSRVLSHEVIRETGKGAPPPPIEVDFSTLPPPPPGEALTRELTDQELQTLARVDWKTKQGIKIFTKSKDLKL